MATDLFSVEQQESAERPLADRMRPANLDEFSGQSHLLDEGKPLQRSEFRSQEKSTHPHFTQPAQVGRLSEIHQYVRGRLALGGN